MLTDVRQFIKLVLHPSIKLLIPRLLQKPESIYYLPKTTAQPVNIFNIFIQNDNFLIWML